MAHEPDEPEIRYVDPKDLSHGPIRHESLTLEQLKRARLIYDCLGRFIGMPFETFELNFLRDMHPDREIEIWACIALAHQTFLQRQPDATEEDARLALKAFLLMSMAARRPDDIPVQTWESLEAIYEGR